MSTAIPSPTAAPTRGLLPAPLPAEGRDREGDDHPVLDPHRDPQGRSPAAQAAGARQAGGVTAAPR